MLREVCFSPAIDKNRRELVVVFFGALFRGVMSFFGRCCDGFFGLRFSCCFWVLVWVVCLVSIPFSGLWFERIVFLSWVLSGVGKGFVFKVILRFLISLLIGGSD